MAKNHTTMHATPERVFAVLADPDSYGHWVVGSRHVRHADPGFPAVGTRFHHRVGIGPLSVADHTEVLESEPQRHLVLLAHARPLGQARVKLTLRPDGERTRVSIEEHLVGRAAKRVPRLLSDPLLQLRNLESLRRLRRLVER